MFCSEVCRQIRVTGLRAVPKPSACISWDSSILDFQRCFYDHYLSVDAVLFSFSAFLILTYMNCWHFVQWVLYFNSEIFRALLTATQPQSMIKLSLFLTNRNSASMSFLMSSQLYFTSTCPQDLFSFVNFWYLIILCSQNK